jgi:hypothetical protein
MILENQTALITGSSGGIGEDFAVEFAKRKVNLVPPRSETSDAE